MNKEELFEKFLNAIRESDFEGVKECVENGVDVNQYFGADNQTPLYLSLKYAKDNKIFSYLVENGADVSKRIGHSDNLYERQSLLYFALNKDGVLLTTIATILNNGGDRDINYALKGHFTPAEIAYTKGNQVLLSLFKNYCDIRVKPGLSKATTKNKNIR